MNYDLIRKARRILQPLWERAYLRGNCWGPKSEKNPYSGNNIVFALGEELVSISQRGNSLIVHEFRKTENTALGKRVKKLLQTLQVKPLILTEEEAIPMTDFMWCCFACGKRRGVDSAFDPYITVQNIINSHREVSPKCQPTVFQFKIYNREFKEETKLLEILSLELVK